MSIQSEEELRGLQRVGQVLVQAMQAMQAAVKPGITTAELDEIGRKVLAHYKAQPAPHFYRHQEKDFPKWAKAVN